MIPFNIQRAIRRIKEDVQEKTGDKITVILEDIAKKKRAYPEKDLIEELENAASAYVRMVQNRENNL